MTRRGRSMAEGQAERTPVARRISVSGLGLRSRWSAGQDVSARRWAKTAGHGGDFPRVRATGIRGRAIFSKPPAHPFNAGSGNSTIGEDTFTRWATIQAGGIPEGEDIELPWTEDELNEREREGRVEVESRAAQEREEIQQETMEQVARHEEAAEEAAAQARHEESPSMRQYYQDIAEAEQMHAADAQYEGQQALRRNAEWLHEAREEIRAQVLSEQQQRQEAAEEYVRDLQDGLAREIVSALNNNYIGNSGVIHELEDWELV